MMQVSPGCTGYPYIYIYIFIKEQFKLSYLHYSINLLLNLWGHRSLCTRMKTVAIRVDLEAYKFKLELVRK